MKNYNVKVIIPASGIGSRFGGDLPKQFQMLGRHPILKRTISAFQQVEYVAEIAVAVPSRYASIVEDYQLDKVLHIVEGGKTRADSVYAALKCFDAKNDDIILIHDGARPFVLPDLIANVVDAAAKHGAAVACLPITDTLKEVDDTGKIKSTLDRNKYWRAQTPQGFTYEVISKAYVRGEEDGILPHSTDDSALVERLGLPVYIVDGASSNIKITTPEDMIIAEGLLL